MSHVDPLTVQVGGQHYKTLAMQPVVFATANRYDPCAFSILKYVTRWRSKNGVQDLEKALHFAQLRQTPDIEEGLDPTNWKHSQTIHVSRYISANNIPDAEAAILVWLDAWLCRTGQRRAEAGNMVLEGLEQLIASQKGSQHG